MQGLAGIRGLRQMLRIGIAVIVTLGLLFSQLHVLFNTLNQEERVLQARSEMSVVTPEIERSKAFIQLMLRQDTVAVRSQMNETYLDNNFDLIMEKVYEQLPKDTPKSIEPVGYMTEIDGEAKFVYVALEYEFKDQWMIAVVTTEVRKQQPIIAGFNVTSYSDSLYERTRFQLSGQSLEHYVLMGLAILNLAFCAISLFICIAAPRVRWRFVWIGLILIGMGLMSFNWLEGRLALDLFSAGLPPTRFNFEVYQPLIILVSVPIGAILFWMNFGKLTQPVEKRLPRQFDAAKR